MSAGLERTPDVAIAFDVELSIVVIKSWEVASYIKVQMKCFFFLIPEFERAAKIRKIAVYRFLISLLVPELRYKGLKLSSFRSKSARKSRRNQSKSIKFVTHVLDILVG